MFCSAISGQQTICFYLADCELKIAEYPDNPTWPTELGMIGSRKIVPNVLLDPVDKAIYEPWWLKIDIFQPVKLEWAEYVPW